MDTLAVVLEGPECLSIRRLDLVPPAEDDVVVAVDWSGVSTGTERLLWTGRMPHFPGMGYPLVPGYEAVGTVVQAGALASARIGQRVFVPGSSNFIDARGLFGGSARTLITPQARAVSLPDSLADQGVLLSLAATAHHAIAGGTMPDLIVGHGVLGRLLLRMTEALGGERPTVWETNPNRREGVAIHPDHDARRDYRAIYDASGAEDLIDYLVARLGRGGEVVLAGFYEARLSFAFPMAFMKEVEQGFRGDVEEQFAGQLLFVETPARALSAGDFQFAEATRLAGDGEQGDRGVQRTVGGAAAQGFVAQDASLGKADDGLEQAVQTALSQD